MVGGVAHGRGCACPTCDPQQLIFARRRADNRAPKPPEPAISPHVAAARYVARAYSPMRHQRVTPESRRFVELLRDGKTAREALAEIEREKGTP